MAKYRVKAPDGKLYDVMGPEGASQEEIAFALHNNLNQPQQPITEPQVPQEDDSSDFFRGFKNYIPQTKQIIGGTQVLAGKAFNAPSLIEAGAERMKAAEAELKTKQSDSFSEAWKQGGLGTVATDWLPYQAGAGAANILESLATFKVILKG